MKSDSEPSHPWIQLLIVLMEVGFVVGMVRLSRPLIMILVDWMPEIRMGEWTMPTEEWVAVGVAASLLLPLIIKVDRLLHSFFHPFT